MLIKTNKAQSTLEYALLIGVVVGVLLTMQNYLKRSMQGRMQATADELGEHYSPGETDRYEYMHSEIGTVTETITPGDNGKTRTEILGGLQNMNSTRKLRAYDREDYRASK